MSQFFEPDPTDTPARGIPAYQPPEPPRRRNVLSVVLIGLLVALVVLLLAIFGLKAIHSVKDHFGSSAPDYSGPGTTAVSFQVNSGDTVTQIGRNLKAKGITKSVDAFLDAAAANGNANAIQVGFYPLKQEMKASDVISILVNPDNLIKSLVVVPEGARVDQVVATIVAKTDITKADLNAALKDTTSLGLPAAADGNVEGYLWPATYDVQPGETAAELLKQMVTTAVSEQKKLGVDAGAAALGLSAHQLVTVASIIEYEASRSQDYPKVARAIYNRLKIGMALQSDATVSYANKTTGEIWTTDEQRNIDSPYNTYLHTGLPPGPIGSPGAETLQAAMHPATGSWLYWVVVNLKTGETVFSTTLADHNKAVEQFKVYCQTSDAC